MYSEIFIMKCMYNHLNIFKIDVQPPKLQIIFKYYPQNWIIKDGLPLIMCLLFDNYFSFFKFFYRLTLIMYLLFMYLFPFFKFHSRQNVWVMSHIFRGIRFWSFDITNKTHYKRESSFFVGCLFYEPINRNPMISFKFRFGFIPFIRILLFFLTHR